VSTLFKQRGQMSPFMVRSILSGDAAHYPEPSLTFVTEGESK
jgi:hypothetical protein